MNHIDFPEICKQLRPFLGTKVDNLFLEYSMADTQQKKQEIYQVIIVLYSKYIGENLLDKSVLLKTPEEGTVAGEYELGKIHYPNKDPQVFGLREYDWSRHMCVTGMSGSGKTTFAIRIIHNFIKKEKPFIVFDWKKSFRKLLYFSDKTLIFTVGKPKVSNLFRLNINRPPKGVGPDEWITIVCDLLCECYGASYGVHKLLTEVMQKAFRDFAVYSGSENYPTWYQIKDRLDKMAAAETGKSRQSEWITSALRIAHSLTFGEFGNTINDKSKYNLTVDELLDHQVVFELDTLGTIEKKFFCSFLLLHIYKSKKANAKSSERRFRNAIIVDEAHNVFLKQKPSFIQESVTDIIYREIREYGVSLICLDQHGSKLSDTVMGNSATNIAFQQILPADIDCMSKLMFLDNDRNIFTKLDVGQAVVKLTERFYDPFLINVERIETPKEIIMDDKLREIMKGHCMFKRKQKLWTECMSTEKLAEQISQIQTIYNQTDMAAPEAADVVEQAQMKKEMEDALEESKPKEIIGMTNHLQQGVYDQIIPRLREKKTIKDAKKSFLYEKYRHADINQAFKYFASTPNGKKIIKFLDIYHNLITKSRSKTLLNKTDPIGLFNFLQKLQQVGDALGVTQFYKELDISSRRGNDIKNSLQELNLVDIREVRSEKGMTKQIGLTSQGATVMERLEMA